MPTEQQRQVRAIRSIDTSATTALSVLLVRGPGGYAVELQCFVREPRPEGGPSVTRDRDRYVSIDVAQLQELIEALADVQMVAAAAQSGAVRDLYSASMQDVCREVSHQAYRRRQARTGAAVGNRPSATGND
jgi:hypothetical protein